MTRLTIREWARIQSEIGSTSWKWCGQIKSTTFLPSNLKVGEPRFRDCEYLEFGHSLQKIWYSWLDQLSANTNPKHLHMRSVATKLSFNWPSNWSNSTCWWCHKVESLVATGLFQADHNKRTNIDLCASAVAFSRPDVIFFCFLHRQMSLPAFAVQRKKKCIHGQSCHVFARISLFSIQLYLVMSDTKPKEEEDCSFLILVFRQTPHVSMQQTTCSTIKRWTSNVHTEKGKWVFR